MNTIVFSYNILLVKQFVHDIVTYSDHLLQLELFQGAQHRPELSSCFAYARRLI
jgi:hypothetical protein